MHVINSAARDPEIHGFGLICDEPVEAKLGLRVQALNNAWPVYGLDSLLDGTLLTCICSSLQQTTFPHQTNDHIAVKGVI